MNSEHLFYNKEEHTLRNILFQSEFNAFCDKCIAQDIRVTALKGISFFGRIYDHSQRVLTDIDVLISKKDLDVAKNILMSLGYKERLDAKWHYNHYKYIYTKFYLNLEIVFEIHTQLLPHESIDSWKTILYRNYYILDPTDELIYLSYHYVYQHTFLNSKWLHDIYQLTILQPHLWSPSIWKNAKQKQLHSAVLFTAHALNSKYQSGIELPNSIKKFFANTFINKSFIDRTENSIAKYYFVKHLTKDSFFKAISYDIKWLLFKLGNFFSK